MPKKSSQGKPSTNISPPTRWDEPPDREFYFKKDPEKKVYKAPYGGGDLYYTKNGSYRLYKRINSSELEEAEWSKAYHKRFSRRQVLKYGAAVAAGAMVTSTLLSYFRETPQTRMVMVESFQRKRIPRLSELVEGKPMDFMYPLDHFSHRNFVVKLGKPAIGGVGPDGDVVAFNYICTHMGCALNGLYNHQYRMLGPCPCHFTRFDLTKNGMVIIGQATQNLPQITLELQGGDIYATGVTRLIYGFRSNLKDVKPLEAA